MSLKASTLLPVPSLAALPLPPLPLPLPPPPSNCIHGSCTRRIALFYRRDQGYRYNELVFHFRRFTAHLPASVEAMFILPGSTPKDVALARKVRAAFREEFRLSEEVAPPLVMYDPSRSPQEPFTRVGVES